MTAPARSATYPLRLEGNVDPRTSRALWLVKWLLLIPHYVVLFFLGLAFMVFTVAAFFAILVTGRYPRALFDFNVGVLRWSWRVGFYGYSALGTDRYPPFSLYDDPSYPARLELQRPEHLSRGLVLVKWWLLAIPHYLVVGLLVGVASYSTTNDDVPVTPQFGLISLLVLFASLVLLFRRRYPEGIFNFVMGLNRWVYRVAAYATLMTDRYPPFALDQGPTEVSAEPTVAAEPTAPADPTMAAAGAGTTEGAATDPALQPSSAQEPAAPGPKDWTAVKVISVAIGSFALFTSLVLLAGGALFGLVDVATEDDDGFLMSERHVLTTSAVAITSENLDLGDGPESFLPEQILGRTRLEARPLANREVFIGVGPTDAVRRYLAASPYDTIVDLRDDRPLYRHHSGVRRAALPQQESFWVAQASGTGRTALTWDPSGGDWTFVVMNADGGAPVAVDASVGAKLPILGTIGAALAITGVLFLVVGLVLIVLPLVSISRRRHHARG